MNSPLISVNIPAYNAEEFIERTITSAINQTYQHIEVVILDDGSSDRTGDIVRQMQNKDSRIRYYYQNNGGLAFTRNRLFDLSKGEYIAFLDHDDEWYSDKLESQLVLFRANPDTALVYGDILNVDDDQADNSYGYFSKRQPHKGRVFYRFLIDGNFIPLSTVIIRSCILKWYLPFKTGLKIAEEWELFLRMSQDQGFDYLNKTVGIYHLHSSRASKDLLLEINECLEILDYWYKRDIKLRSSYRNQFLDAKSNLNLQKAYFYKNNRQFRQGFNELANCIRINPLRIKFYLKLLKYFLLFVWSSGAKMLSPKKALIRND